MVNYLSEYNTGLKNEIKVCNPFSYTHISYKQNRKAYRQIKEQHMQLLLNDDMIIWLTSLQWKLDIWEKHCLLTMAAFRVTRRLTHWCKTCSHPPAGVLHITHLPTSSGSGLYHCDIVSVFTLWVVGGTKEAKDKVFTSGSERLWWAFSLFSEIYD